LDLNNVSLVRVFDSGAENEGCVFLLKFKRAIGLFEHDQLAPVHGRWRREAL
jgi:hypothetical protein